MLKFMSNLLKPMLLSTIFAILFARVLIVSAISLSEYSGYFVEWGGAFYQSNPCPSGWTCSSVSNNLKYIYLYGRCYYS
jgi:hypothetical protein